MIRALINSVCWCAFADFCNTVIRAKQRHERALERGEIVICTETDPLESIAGLFAEQPF